MEAYHECAAYEMVYSKLCALLISDNIIMIEMQHVI